ncbi:MAG: hypothetical protein H0W09_01875 [Solirubrobacterales bacterium]|nr:hypothetical protein [Solirubrobacterales bacterium]
MEESNEIAAAKAELYADAEQIYERARHEVTIERKDGSEQRYAATRFKQQIDRGRSDGTIVSTVAHIVRRRTVGFGHLEAAKRPDLMLEVLILDESKSYHRLFSPTTIEIARERMEEYRRRNPG